MGRLIRKVFQWSHWRWWQPWLEWCQHRWQKPLLTMMFLHSAPGAGLHDLGVANQNKTLYLEEVTQGYWILLQETTIRSPEVSGVVEHLSLPWEGHKSQLLTVTVLKTRLSLFPCLLLLLRSGSLSPHFLCCYKLSDAFSLIYFSACVNQWLGWWYHVFIALKERKFTENSV